MNKTGKYVAFYRLKDYKGGHICITSDKKLTSNTCSKFMD
ncbi:hypothetical protein [Streptomyces coeruleorubidus]